MNRKWKKCAAVLAAVFIISGGMSGQSAAAAYSVSSAARGDLPIGGQSVSSAARGDLPVDAQSVSVGAEENIRVIGYEIKDTNDKRQLSELKAGDTALVKVTVRDSRPSAQELAFAGAKINTDAFRLADIEVMLERKAPEYGDAFVKNIVENQKMYTLYFYVNYTGAGKNFDFDLFYHAPSASLKMENVKLILNQCVPSDGSDGDLGGSGSGDDFGGSGSDGSTGGDDNVSGSSDDADGREAALTATKLFVQSFDYGETMPKAGDSIALKINLAASAGSYSIQNVRVTAQFPESVTLLKNTNQYYLGTIGAGTAAEAVYHIGISEDMTGDACEIKLAIEGIELGGAEVKTEEVITLPIKQSERLEIESISMPEKINTVYDDGSGVTQITLVNRGSAPAEIIEISVDGEDLQISEGGGDLQISKDGGNSENLEAAGSPESFQNGTADSEDGDSTAALGGAVLEAGKRKTYGINLRASKEGMLSGAVTVRYRGSDGKEKVLEKTVKTEGVAIKAEVSKNVTIDKEIIVEEENVPVWAWLVTAAGISLGVYVIARILYDKWRTEKKRKEI